MGLWAPERLTPAAAQLIDEIGETAAPLDALHVVADLAGHDPTAFAAVQHDPVWRARLLAVAGSSRPLGDFVVRHPEALAALRTVAPVDAGAVAAWVREAVGKHDEPGERAAAVARIRRTVTAVVAARDLTGAAELAEVTADLARLADGVVAGALDVLRHEHPPVGFCVVGMGKLGGQELNYLSDIDIIFVHGPADDRTVTGDHRAGSGRPAAHGDAAAQTAHRLVSALLGVLGGATAAGRAYHLDLDLRPEGHQGPLSRTVAGYRGWWQRWAETWEFQALLKARPVAGDLALGNDLVAAAEPFVYPERLEPGVVDAIREVKNRVEAQPEVRTAGSRQLKLGPGGLRDIEFAVQLLQLVHGRADPSLRRRGTLPALAALADGGYVAVEDAETFADAYRWLRTVEHRLQLADERRTHVLPDDPERLECLARSLGYRPAGQEPARAGFEHRLREVQGHVRDLHAKLFYRPLLELHAAVSATDGRLVGGLREEPGVPSGQRLDREAARTRMEALGFHDGNRVVRDVTALTRGVSRRARTLQAVLPTVLHTLSDSPDPDGGLTAFRSLVESQPADSRLVATLRDQPPVAQLLARLLGTSQLVGELLTSRPQGLAWVADPAARAHPRSRDELVAAALGLLGWQDDLAARQAALRRFKRRELVRIVVRDLAGDAPVGVVASELTALGEACLEAGLAAVMDALTPPGTTPPARIAVIGLGKLGGGELHYPSDLDVMLVHAPTAGADGRAAATFAGEVAEQLLEMLSAVTAEGTAFEVDAELRPEGRTGPLSRSLGSCRAYYARWSQVWEHQALTKARPVAGDRQLGAAFARLAAAYAYPPTLDEGAQTAMRTMKARLERDRLPAGANRRRHLKLGPGGLSDIEWTVQLLQRRHGGATALLRTTSTAKALDGLVDAELADVRDVRWLADAYRFLSQVRNRLYLLRQPDVDVLPGSHPTLEKLARSLGYERGGRQRLEADYLRHTRRVRRVTERLFYDQP